MRCVIFSGADIHDYDFVASFLRSDDFVICADSGLRHAEKLGITADLLIGDFDSAEEINPDLYKAIVTLPCDKDDTDTFAAAKRAADLGAKEALIFGALGTRLDHTLGNIAALEYLCGRGVSARIIGEHNEIGIISDETVRIKKRDNCYLSLIPLDRMLHGVYISGVKYPLDNADVSRASTLTVSNEITADFADVTVKEGTALYIISHD